MSAAKALKPGTVVDLGYKVLKVASVVVDEADIAERMTQPHVIELAKSVKDTIPIHAPTVNRVKGSSGPILLAGRDRMAAYRLGGLTEAWFHLVQTDAKGAAQIEEDENLRRRGAERDAAIAKAVEERAAAVEEVKAAEEAEAAKTDAENPDKSSGKSKPKKPDKPAKIGRPKSAKGEARAEVAKKAGTSPEAIRKAEARAKKKTEAEKAPSKPAEPRLHPRVESFGVLVSATFVSMIDDILVGLDTTDRHLKSAQGSVTRMGSELAIGEMEAGALPKVKAMLHDTAALVRSLMPKCVCPYCKDPDNTAGRRETCKACDNRGYLSEGQAQGIPPELLVPGKHALVSDGGTGFVPLHKAA